MKETTSASPSSIDKVLAFWKRISFPRVIGTEGDARAQALIEESFKEVPGASVNTQDFTMSKAYMDGVLNSVHPTIGALMIITFITVLLRSIYAVFVLSLILFFLALFNRQIIRFLQFRVQGLGKPIPAKNIWTTMEPHQEVKQTLVFVAHYDSISHVLTPLVEGIGYTAGFLGGIFFAIHGLTYSIPVIFFSLPAGSFWQFIWGLPLALIAMMELINKKGNESAGAIDNASGVAQGYHLALALAEEPLERTRVVLLETGAEEWGDYGAHAFVQENPVDLDPDTAKFVIVDSIGMPEKNQLIYGIGYPVKSWSPYLERTARELLEEEPAPISMFSIPPLLQIASDHIPVLQAGFECIWAATSAFVFHSERDTVELLDEDNFQAICEFLEQLARQVDRDPWVDAEKQNKKRAESS